MENKKATAFTVELPCEVGTEVYAIIERHLRKCRVETYIIDAGRTSTVQLSYFLTVDGKKVKKHADLYIFKFGKTWFWDYDEAQKAFLEINHKGSKQ